MANSNSLANDAVYLLNTGKGNLSLRIAERLIKNQSDVK